jgi:anaerobic sulfite reductase subunit C
MSNNEFDLTALRKVGMIQQKQKEYFVMRLHAVAGDFTAEQMKKVSEVAERFGKGQIHLSTRQGIEIHFVHYSKIEDAKQELESAGIAMGVCGPRIRIIAGCPGGATCKMGIIETKEIARELDRRHFKQETPYKFKLAVTGCPNNCAKANENDIGVMGGIEPVWDNGLCSDCGVCEKICPAKAITKSGDAYTSDSNKCINCGRCASSCPTGAWRPGKSGYILWLGGTMGKFPRIATRVPGVIESKERLFELINRAIEYYRTNGRKKERFGHTMDRIGVDKVIEEIMNGKN